MTNEVKISVVIPAYNYAHTLVAAIKSVRNQNISGLEIIVINDASTDNTHELMLGLQDEDLRYIVNPVNLGVNKTINKGFRTAKGKFVCILAADDELPQNSLLSRYEHITSQDYDAVHAGETVIENGVEKYYNPLDTTKLETIIDFLNDGSDTHGINNASFIFNRRIFAKIGYRDERKEYFPHNDFEFVLRVLLHCNTSFIDVPAYVYERHPKSHSDIFGANPAAVQRGQKLRSHYADLFTKKIK